MLYESTKIVLRSMLRSLQCPGTVEWDSQIELGRECLFEIHQMARPMYKAYRNEGANALALVPVYQRASLAIPHVKSMVRAIRRKDHAGAVQYGQAALAEM